jgi:D-threo-aldose 1-dehydrogenase
MFTRSVPSLSAPRPLGRTRLRVTPMGAGGSVLGSNPRLFGYEVPEERAIATALSVLSGPLNLLDTAAGYSNGESERRIGLALAKHGLPPGFVISTKAGRNKTTGEFTGSTVRQSVHDSLRRLGLNSLPLVFLHDPEYSSFDPVMRPNGPVHTLMALQRDGVIEYIGVAGGPVDLLLQYMRTGYFQVVLTHNRWTPVDRSAAPLLDAAVTLGIGVLNAAPFGGGILAAGSDARQSYAYAPAEPQLLASVRALEVVCSEHRVPLAAAALQFSLTDERIASTLIGISRPDRVQELLRLASLPLPRAVWDALETAPDQQRKADNSASP